MISKNPIIEIIKEKEFVSFYDYISLALYHEEWGYYRKDRNRVGHSADTDFFTASSLGAVFSQLVLGAIQELYKDKDLSEYQFIELGCEAGRSIADDWKDSPFQSHLALGSSDSLLPLSGKCVLYSNELLDAQPFVRMKYLEGEGWQEMGIFYEEGQLVEKPLSQFTKEAEKILHHFSEPASDCYTVDYPIGAENLAEKLFSMPWEGLWLAMDYGKDWRSLRYEMPQGSARTYFNHTMGDDLTKGPGSMDITHHICWNHLETLMKRKGFSRIEVLRQESFFMRYSNREIENIMSETGEGYSAQKGTLMELLHPGNMGAKFQVLSGFRK